MNIKAFFEYESTAIPVDEIFSLTESVLDDLYITSSEAEQFNIYFQDGICQGVFLQKITNLQKRHTKLPQLYKR